MSLQQSEFTTNGVIPVLDTGMALLHSNRKNLAVTDKIVSVQQSGLRNNR
ncbi:hypothetical protein [Wolbachia endosymbiont of Oedothorax gibbosus]|nr:hypothetical protein [Wolbachia endosymbiont of Oedothorax gibbosus]